MSGVRRVAQIAVAVVLAVAGACGGPPPSAPSPSRPTIQGAWSGAVRDGLRGTGELRLTLTGSDTIAAGPFTMTFPDHRFDLDGTATAATREGDLVDVLFRTTSPSGCANGLQIALDARVTLSAAQLTGTYDELFPCGDRSGGSLALARR